MRGTFGWLPALAGILAASQLQATAADDTATETSVVTATVQADSGGGASERTDATASGGGGVVVKDTSNLWPRMLRLPATPAVGWAWGLRKPPRHCHPSSIWPRALAWL